MKKAVRILTISAAVISLISFSSCKRFRPVRGSGVSATEKRTVVDFEKIDISGGFNVHIRQDSSSAVTITADDNLLKYIKTSVEGGKLRIYSTRNFFGGSNVSVSVGFKHLRALEASGGVEVVGDGHINTGDFDLDLSGSTNVKLDITAARVHTEGSGSTEISLKGQATSHDIDMSGSGTVDALDFVVGKYNIETSGASHCRINVLTDLSVHTSGSSEIEYRGNPSNVNSDKSGSSSITKIN
ncbi:DUF2807 domain-containing protein [Mucilaginibacter terrenus]|uniref:DUF2807 domain-containing protein n=1 Tax=Mucilaginibacter terrenus TaxID=2482727 RepID=A0A3E2NWW0_9SPHI|nr:head GIN domain-containing protein [Mucilaginibacter terrenus]RFZ85498.1 DUF2807 domain-containing protein [Mucilaginibacter terrenus]